MKKVNIADKLGQFTDHWNPRIIGSLNGQHVKVAKLKGEFPWHQHDHEDELFYVVKGELELQFRDSSVTLREGEFLIVPKGVEHRPLATNEVEIMLFEPMSTINTGGLEDNDFTRRNLDQL